MKKFFLFLLIIIIIISTTTVLAEYSISLENDSNNSSNVIVKIIGESNLPKGSLVSIYIKKEEHVLFLEVYELDNQSYNFSFTIPIEDTDYDYSGLYTVYVNDEDFIETLTPKSFTIITNKQKDDFVKQIQNFCKTNNYSALKSFLIDDYNAKFLDAFEMDFTFFKNMTGDKQTNFLEMFASLVDNVELTRFDVKEKFGETKIIFDFSKIELDEITNVIDDITNSSFYELMFYDNYLKAIFEGYGSDTTKKTTFNQFLYNLKDDINSIENFKKNVCLAIIYTEITTTNRPEIRKFITDYNNQIIKPEHKDELGDYLKFDPYYQAMVEQKLVNLTKDEILNFSENFKTGVKTIKNTIANTLKSGNTKGSGSITVNKTYNQPTVDHTIIDNAHQAEIIKFKDVDSNHWAYEAISELAKKNIVSGYSNEMFNPNDNISRAEFTKILVSALKLTNKSEHLIFNDLLENDWFYSYISVATANNLVHGKTVYEFMPNEKITRQDVAVMIFRGIMTKKLYFKETERQSKFNDDNQIADYANEAVDKLKKSEYILGDENGNFRPTANMSRAECVTIIYRLLKMNNFFIRGD